MKQFLYIGLIWIVLFMQSCGGGLIKNKNNDSDQTSSKSIGSKIPVPVTTDNLVITDEKDLTGYWVGTFGPDTTGHDTSEYYGEDEQYNKINISIDEIISSQCTSGHISRQFINCLEKYTLLELSS